MAFRDWEPLRYHPVQQAYWHSTKRHNVVPAGRRSGKTYLAKRKLVVKAALGNETLNARFFAAAPTRDQAKRIWWDDLKQMTPPELIKGKPYETDLMIPMKNGSQLWVVGLDKPQRIEGTPWDGGVLDEYGNCKAEAWELNIRPALSDRNGWCDFIGVPEGRNHYFELYEKAQKEIAEKGDASDWGIFHWVSADILPASEIEAARRDLDDLSYQQEYEASFVTFEGRCYYPFLSDRHCAPLKYDPRADLVFCFDFNVSPGVAAVLQEQDLPSGEYGTGVIGEVNIPRNSSTPAVCRKLIDDWGDHQGRVFCYGDATGGARGSAKVQGSDWDLIRATLGPHFGDRIYYRVPKANPPERVRINSVNSRIESVAGDVKFMVDRAKAPHVVRDFEGVRLLEGGSGEIDKRADPMLSHVSDAIGYYIEYEFPLIKRTIKVVRTTGH